MKRSHLLCLCPFIVAAACARPYPPAGGEQDKTPPRLIETTPEALAVVPNYGSPAVFRFDERLSERGFSETLVVVSPLDGALRVDRGRNEVRVGIDGGWRPNRVYRLILLPGLRDLFGNARTEPIELVFSTGPPVPNTAIAGIVMDRITGRPARDAVVNAVRRADTVSYMAVGDSAGFFALRHLPLGVYDLRAFGDQNRNRRRDPTEPVDSGRFLSLGTPADTQTAVFSVLAADSTGPRLTGAEAVDSLHVRLTFDDYLDPDAPLSAVQGEVHVLPDSTLYATTDEALSVAAWDRRNRAAADSARPRAPGDTTRAAPPRPARPASPADDIPLPDRSIIVRIAGPLTTGTRYAISVSGVVNLHGLRGGGSAAFEMRARAPARQTPPVRRDTLSFRPH